MLVCIEIWIQIQYVTNAMIENTSNQWRLFSTSERDSLKYLRIVTLLIKRRESYDYWKRDGYNKKGAKKNSGEQWRSKLYRRLIGPICQFVASTKQATPLSNPISSPGYCRQNRSSEFSKGTALNQSHLQGGTRQDLKIKRFDRGQTLQSFSYLFTTDSSIPCFTTRFKILNTRKYLHI